MVLLRLQTELGDISGPGADKGKEWASALSISDTSHTIVSL